MPYIQVLLLKVLAACFVPTAADTLREADETAYYRCFDLVNFTPSGKIDKKAGLPYVKVIRDSAGIKRVEAYRTNAKKPTKVYNRIKYKQYYAFSSTTKFFYCTTVDTLIVLPNRLFEFRSCYYNSTSEINDQELLYYESAGRDSINLKYLTLSNLIKHPSRFVPVDTSLNIFQISQKESKAGFRDDFLIRANNSSMQVYCKTKNSTWCKSGAEEVETYPYNGCLYWSLFYHRIWNSMQK